MGFTDPYANRLHMMQYQNNELHGRLRWLSASLGAVILAGAFLLLFFPPQKSSRELDGHGALIRITWESSDVTTPFLVIFLAGFGLLLFAVNGLRFTKISAAGVSAEVSTTVAAAKGYYEARSEDRPKLEIAVENKESPESSAAPTGSLEAEDGRYAVYKLDELPTSVIDDALREWPPGESKPEELSSFEFATRRTGKGNHPWTLKFKGKKAVVVSYGGYGKGKATVAISR